MPTPPTPTLTLVRAARTAPQPPVLDAVQQAAVDHRVGGRGGVLRVLGGPGTGKTTVVVETVAARVLAGELAADECLVLTATRSAAARLRDAITGRLGVTTAQPLARTHSSFGFGLLRQAMALAGEPAPRLLSGPEQDVVLRELLAGHADPSVAPPPWPERVRLALPTRAFRGELRDLLMRAVECELGPGDLAALGEAHDRPEWVAAAHVLEEYEQVTALAEPAAFDPALILGRAAELLETDPDAAARLARTVRVVVVDDAQELTAPGLRLLRAVVGAGVPEVVLVGDPDVATQTFRGADPRLLTSGWMSLCGNVSDVVTGSARGRGAGGGQLLLPMEEAPATTLRLPTAYRLPVALHAVCQRVAGHIGVVGESLHRDSAPGRPGGSVEAHLLRSGAQEASFVAGVLREAHLLSGVPWSQMAVVVRGQARAGMLRRVLAASGVPVSAATSDLPVRDEVAVRPLLAMLDVVTGAEPTAEWVVDVHSSPLGGSDAVAVRRLRRGLRQAELEGGGGRPSDELLGEAVRSPTLLLDLGPEASGARRVARVLQAGHTAVAAGGDAAGVLWAMWDASGLASAWREQAFAGGAAGARADRDLDAVVALLDAAATFADRLPQAPPRHFLDHVLGQDVPGDTLVPRAPSGDTVTLTTPAAAAGRSWRLVCVAGVQEGSWPDLRVRGTLLGTSELVDAVRGRRGDHRAALAAVRHDETRLFLVAASRAGERLVVTAVRSDDEQPSPYLDVVDPRQDGAAPRGLTDDPRLLTLPALVAHLRRTIVTGDPEQRGAAVGGLARLAAAGVRGADPRGWWGLVEHSDDRPMRGSHDEVRISPSRLESYAACGLRWLLTGAGGEGPSKGAAELGTLIHGVVHDLGDLPPERARDAVTAQVDARWGRLGVPSGWVGERKRAEAQDMVDRLTTYLAAASEQGWRRVASEESMRVALGRTVIRGTVDRVEARDGVLRIVDLKTGSSKPTRKDLEQHPQLGAYQLAASLGAFERHGQRCGGAVLVQIGKAGGTKAESIAQEQAALEQADDPGWARAMVEEASAGMSGVTVRATPSGSHCRTCPVMACCPARSEGAML